MTERDEYSHQALKAMERTTTNLMVIAGIGLVLFVVVMQVLAGID